MQSFSVPIDILWNINMLLTVILFIRAQVSKKPQANEGLEE